MYKIITIDEKDYKLEYTIEAALYKECTEKLIEFMGKTIGASEAAIVPKEMDEAQQYQYLQNILHQTISGITNIPDVALTIFYAGLLEHHGEDGDRSIVTQKDAKRLVKKYFKEQENVENGVTDFVALINLCLEQMGEDGFFKRTGLETILMKAAEDEQKPNRAARRAKRKDSEN